MIEATWPWAFLFYYGLGVAIAAWAGGYAMGKRFERDFPANPTNGGKK
jgi:hypothetical protein